MPYVYFLSDGDDDGAENVHATMIPSRLPAMLNRHFPTENTLADDMPGIRARLSQLLEEYSPDQLAAESQWDLLESQRSGRWGAVKLYVVELE